MAAQVNIAHLPAQHIKIATELKNNIAQNHQKSRGMEQLWIKETTSIQTGRRGRDAEQAGSTSTCGR